MHMIQYVFAFLAGVLTVASPCVLPMLPIVLGASIGRTSRLRPLFITLGFVLSFAGVGLAFNVFSHVLGLSQDVLRTIAIVFLAVFGVLMLFPTVLEWVNVRLSNVLARTGIGSGATKESLTGAIVIGMTLGILWTPCAGPVLGSILALVGSANTIAKGGMLLALYAVGAGVPMLAIAYGGQYATTRVRRLNHYTRRIQQVFGLILIALSAALYFQYDTLIEAWLANYYPDIGNGL